MIKDNIILGTEDNGGLGKMEIALAIRNSTYEEELKYYLLAHAVVNSCNDCNLRPICQSIDRVAQDYLVSTTKVVSSFSFQ